MPEITVTLTKEQLKDLFDDEIRALPKLGVLDSLEVAVQKQLKKSFPTNHITQIKASEFGAQAVTFKINFEKDENSEEIKKVLMNRY